MIEVAAAVLERADGSFLLAQRPAGKVYAGYWEFPGGKIEPGEAADRALARELKEELGIDIGEAFPWITRIYTYPHGTVRLHFYRVFSWTGDPHPLEEQAISWQRPEAAMAAPMLPANAPVLAALRLPHEYAVTDARRFGLPVIERRLRAGLKLLQVREPEGPESEAFTRKVLDLAHRHGCRVMTKAPFPGADGVHVTAARLMALAEKPAPFAAASCHTREELERAMTLGFDFAVLGSVKGEKGELGWAGFAALVRDATIPVYAIGGLSRDDLRDAWRAGAHGVAMIRGAWA